MMKMIWMTRMTKLVMTRMTKMIMTKPGETYIGNNNKEESNSTKKTFGREIAPQYKEL